VQKQAKETNPRKDSRRKKKMINLLIKRKLVPLDRKIVLLGNPSASSKDNPDVVERNSNKMLELLGYAVKFVHVIIHLQDF